MEELTGERVVVGLSASHRQPTARGVRVCQTPPMHALVGWISRLRLVFVGRAPSVDLTGSSMAAERGGWIDRLIINRLDLRVVVVLRVLFDDRDLSHHTTSQSHAHTTTYSFGGMGKTPRHSHRGQGGCRVVAAGEAAAADAARQQQQC
jgi:hypothetical protein